ncbi:MAG: hypothetical protein IKA74_03260 [Clostridia bacterium]|nr:hypothetical protein [Clostridia bacterium]
MRKLYMIGNTHFDPVWLWKWDEAMASVRATFRAALDRMKENDKFIYSFATPPVFEWIRKTDPEMFEEIKARVAEGRWDLAEGWWLQPDCYGATGESYVRQGLYGQRYLMEHFGKYSDTVFNIDSFGHSPMLPQILKKSKISNYCFVRPEKHHIELKNPLFNWKSADGSAVTAYRAHKAYEYEWQNTVKELAPDEDALVVYGVTDHGGAPTKKAIAEIEADAEAEFSTVSGFFDDHSTDYTVDFELLTGDFGPYSNYSKIKKLNRIAEYAVLNAEKSSLIADKNDTEKLTEVWKDILFNQFHDILGGACIKDAYFDAENMYGRAISTANEIMHVNLQSVTRKIKMPGKNPDNIWNIVVWNLNGSEYDGYIEVEVQWVHEFPWYDKGICLEDAEGNRYPCQIIREKSVIPRFRSRFIFKAKIPPVGYKAFKLIKTEEDVVKKAVDPYKIETDRLCVEFSENGTVKRVVSKLTGKAVAKNLFIPAVCEDKGDTWCFNIEKYEPVPSYFDFCGFKIIEPGEHLTEIKATYKYNSSVLEIYYRFYNDSEYFDVRYRANWEEKHKVLKLELDAKNERHTVAVPAGSVERGENPADVPLGAWISVDGYTVAPTSVFAYNLHNQRLGLTLLRSAIYGDLRLSELDDEIDHDIIDRGIVEGSLRIGFDGSTWTMAEQFNNPPIVIDEANHAGEFDANGSYCSVSDNGVLVSAWKRTEEGNAQIIRLIECDGREKTLSVDVQGKEYSTQISPYEIKTLKIENGKISTVDMLEK